MYITKSLSDTTRYIDMLIGTPSEIFRRTGLCQTSDSFMNDSSVPFDEVSDMTQTQYQSMDKIARYSVVNASFLNEQKKSEYKAMREAVYLKSSENELKTGVGEKLHSQKQSDPENML